MDPLKPYVALEPGEIAVSAAEMFNALTRAHNAQIQRFGADGLSGAQASLATYIAHRLMLENIETLVRGAVGVEQWERIEAIVELLKEKVVPVNRVPYKPKVTA